MIKDREKLKTKKTISFTFLPKNTKHTSYQISSLVLKQRHLVLEDLPLASRHQLRVGDMIRFKLASAWIHSTATSKIPRAAKSRAQRETELNIQQELGTD